MNLLYVWYALTAITLIFATLVVVARNPVYSILSLIVTFFCLSGHYLLLNAQFLAAANIIVYAGAIMVLFLFVIMFLNLRRNAAESKGNITKLVATIIGGMLGVLIIAAIRKTPIANLNSATYDSQIGVVENLGKVLFREYLLPFELITVLFFVALVGAVMLGKREEGERNF